MVKGIGITGFGRIGRMILRACSRYPELEIRAINATVEPEYMAYLLKYDSVHGRLDREARHTDKGIIIGGRETPCFSSRDPEAIDWEAAGVEYLIDATGKFKTLEKASAHLRAGAKKVIITSPSDDAPMFVMGVNNREYTPDMNVVSNASCTTNALAPLAKIINDRWGISSGIATTIHAATASQKTVDGASPKDRRGGRAFSANIIPSTTGAAAAVGKIIPALEGKLTAISMRVPTINVSAVDFTVNLETPASYADICAEMKLASETYMKGIFGYTEDPVVSSDFIHDERTSIFDSGAGVMLTDTFAKLIAWYDNEWGYSCKTLDLLKHMIATDSATVHTATP
jgi:glyceraldehyde 3-phosphate dehydrogenase